MNLYETVPYPPLTHSHTHPDRLAVAGRLMGLDVARPDACRVLDLGCGNGANLIAMAELLPNSRFLGIDLSPRQIEDGRRIAASTGVDNVRLDVADILDLPDRLGEFDYVIAHGLFSWVPDSVRDKSLRIIRDSLAPAGIAYVSYNAYPGWYQLAPLRDMMRYHTRHIDDPAEKASAAREFIGFLAASQTEATAFGLFLQHYHSSFQGRGPVSEEHLVSTLLHDELSDINQPFYFHEFTARAQAAGLQFLAEADLEGSTPVGLRPEVVEKLRSFAGSATETEQYLDFIRNRGFRRTLLCPAEAPVQRSLRADRYSFDGLLIASPLKAGHGRDKGKFVSPDGLAISTDIPVVAVALSVLGRRHPGAIAFEELLGRALSRIDPGESAHDLLADLLAATLLRFFLRSRSLVELYVSPSPVATRPPAFARATVYARLMAAAGEEKVPNLRHEQVQLSPLARLILPLLDGTRSRSGLAAFLADQARASGLGVDVDKALRDELAWLAKAGMLQS